MATNISSCLGNQPLIHYTILIFVCQHFLKIFLKFLFIFANQTVTCILYNVFVNLSSTFMNFFILFLIK
ncbi:hypothetical protein HMPREF3188_00934 [Tissierellia bacterium KA00581]|nr:hypothetical protein HMPREF3188_00934 [Tissierellia bacterium KA00581]